MSAAARRQQTRQHLLITASIGVFALIWLAWNEINANNKWAEREQINAKNQQIEQTLQRSKEEKREISEHLQILQKIEEAGLSQAENRSAWVERLLTLHQALNLPSLSYEFRPQSILPEQEESRQKWLSSPLHLHLERIHEGDLINVLNRLPELIPAKIITRQCHLRRQKPLGLAADCEFELITLSPAVHSTP